MGARSRSQPDNRSRIVDSGPHPADYPLGSVQSRAAARAIIERSVAEERKELSALENLTDLELATSERVKDPRVKVMLVRLVREVMRPRSEIYGTPLPTPELVRHEQQLSREIDEMESEGIDVHAKSQADLRELAEKRLQEKKSAR